MISRDSRLDSQPDRLINELIIHTDIWQRGYVHIQDVSNYGHDKGSGTMIEHKVMSGSSKRR